MVSIEELQKQLQLIELQKQEIENQINDNWKEKMLIKCKEFWLSPGGMKALKTARERDYKNI